MPASITRAWRRALRWLLLAAFASALVTLAWLAAIATLALSRTPDLAAQTSVSPEDVERALQLLKRHDPRWQRPGIVRAVAAEERDINLLLAHAGMRLPGLRAKLRLKHNAAELRFSVDLARLLPGIAAAARGTAWLNGVLELGPNGSLPEVRSLRLGPVPVPAWVAEALIAKAASRLGGGLDLQLLREVIRRIDLREGRVLAFYAWQDDTSARLLAALTPQAEQERLRAYAERLAQWTAAQAPASVVSLAPLLQGLFELARQRVAGGGDAMAESRAALLTATLYANRRGIAAVVPAARAWPRPRWMLVTLAGRTDTPLHFLISAALAAESGSPLADAVGLYKELADSRGGSGFSFHDLAADRAGMRLGELAKRDPARLQSLLAQASDESALLPDISDLPEQLSEEQFEQRYGGVGAPAYARMVSEIDARLDRVPLLR